jgi:hypothetical protein
MSDLESDEDIPNKDILSKIEIDAPSLPKYEPIDETNNSNEIKVIKHPKGQYSNRKIQLDNVAIEVTKEKYVINNELNLSMITNVSIIIKLY